MTLPDFSTPDLSDAHPDARILEPLFKSYGGKRCFGGQIVTVKCFEDNSMVKALAGKDGGGKVMVVDGGASLRCALLGDLIASTAAQNGWAGFVINGCIRDVDIIATLPLGVKALNTHPRKTEKRDLGDINVAVCFAGQTMIPGHYLYADNNGILISDKKLLVS